MNPFKTKIWEELDEEEKQWWGKVAEGITLKTFTAVNLLKEEGCFWCNKKINPFPNMAVHIQTTHGLPYELLIKMINNLK